MPDDQIALQGAENRLSDMYHRDFPKHTTFKPKKALTVGVKFELEILRLKAISLFGELCSSEYDPTSIERHMEGNN
jgi:hypothetical protein